MGSGMYYSGKWAVKNSGKLPIFIRSMINTSFNEKYALGLFKNVPKKRLFANYTMFWPSEDYKAFENEIIEKTKKKELIKKVKITTEMLFSEIFVAIQYSYKIDWSKKSNKDLLSFLKEIIEKERAITLLWYTQYAFDEYFENEITKFIKSRIGDKDKGTIDETLSILTSLDVLTDTMKENIAVAKLSILHKNKNYTKEDIENNLADKIIKIQKDYGHTKFGLSTNEHPTSFSDIVERIIHMDLDKAERIVKENNISSKKRMKREIIKKLNPSKRDLFLIQDATLANNLRNTRIDEYSKLRYYMVPILREIAKRKGLNYPEMINNVAIWEIENFLSDGKTIPKKELIKREKDYVMLVDNEKNEIITEEKKKNSIIKKYHLDITKEDILRGMVAFKGYSKGKARIVMDASDIHKVKKGDILVAQFTTPDFIMAMEKSSAIITDQGGITSHAAIVSRELKKPCIIDTKKATRILRDGDLVEVNANMGIVKKIK